MNQGDKAITKKAYMLLLATLVWFAICTQFYISTEKYLAEGRTFGGAIVQLLSYFTIQNNILVALSLTLLLFIPHSKWGSFFSRFSVRTAIAMYITIVCLVYQLVLRKEHQLHGLFRLTDEIFHTVCPILFVLFWIIFVPKNKIPWDKCITWLIYPLVYFVYLLIRGALSGLYPYSFIDANKLSPLHIFINFIFLLLAFLGIGAIFIAAARLLKRAG